MPLATLSFADTLFSPLIFISSFDISFISSIFSFLHWFLHQFHYATTLPFSADAIIHFQPLLSFRFSAIADFFSFSSLAAIGCFIYAADDFRFRCRHRPSRLSSFLSFSLIIFLHFH
jgi:hypothetical protein